MHKLKVYILAGGQSKRFGADKARAIIQGEPILVRQANQWSTNGYSVTVVASSIDCYSDLSLASIADERPYQGPLSGLRTVLEFHQARNLASPFIVTSCDFLSNGVDLIRPLLDAWNDECWGVVYQSDRYQPFPGLYSTHCLEPVRATFSTCKLDSGYRPSMQNFLKGLNGRLITKELDAAVHLHSFNTPAELQNWIAAFCN